VVTTKLISETFDHPIEINRHAGRWTATARRGTRPH
jgi:iron complex transport system ATP-binding protein